ncbi:hypothetical protein VTH06DRAFT_2863 [Thermothelomyces fergusii]
MKSAVLVASLLASLAAAQPHGHGHAHHHRRKEHGNNKRAVVTTWVVETVYETVTAYIDDTTTELIMPSTKADSTTFLTSTTTEASTEDFIQDPETSSTTSSTTTSTQAQATTSEAAPPPPPPPPPPQPSTNSPQPILDIPSLEVSLSLSLPSPSPSPEPPADEARDAGYGGFGGQDTRSGEVTYYALGLGSCGVDDSGKDHIENIVAVSSALMGAQSNGNPLCGKTITVKANGRTAQARVHDKCPSCDINDIDASEKLFLELFGTLDVGRGHVEWYFNE